MWLYCNPQGDVLSAYYDVPVRQGNSFYIYVCFPYDELSENKDRYLNMTVSANFTFVGKDPVTEISVVSGQVRVFPGVSNNVSGMNTDTGMLIKGRKYVVYTVLVSNPNVIGTYGKISFYISTSDYGNIGNGFVYIQRTYGNNQLTTITPGEYQSLLDAIKRYSMVVEQYMNAAEGFSIDGELSLKSWGGLGFIDGVIVVGTVPEGDDDEFTTVATFDGRPLSVLKQSCTIFGIITSGTSVGSDVEFRIENINNIVTLGISNSSPVTVGDKITLTACIPFDASALKIVGEVEGDEEDVGEIVVSGIAIDISQTLPAGSQPTASYTLVKTDDSEAFYKLKFVFNFAQPDGALSSTSENAIQNKVVTAALATKANISDIVNYYQHHIVITFNTEAGARKSLVFTTDIVTARGNQFNWDSFREYVQGVAEHTQSDVYLSGNGCDAIAANTNKPLLYLRFQDREHIYMGCVTSGAANPIGEESFVSLWESATPPTFVDCVM